MAQLAKLLATKFDDLTLILGTRWRKERMDSRELSPDRHVVPWMVVITRRERRECTHALKKCNNKKKKNKEILDPQRSPSLEEEEGVWALGTYEKKMG